MKSRLSFILSLSALCASLAVHTGCSSAKLAVHVDIYEDRLPEAEASAVRRFSELKAAVKSYREALNELFTFYDSTVQELYAGNQPGPQKTRLNLLDHSKKLKESWMEKLDEAERWLTESRVQAIQARKAEDPLERLNKELQAQWLLADAAALLVTLAQDVRAQCSDDPNPPGGRKLAWQTLKQKAGKEAQATLAKVENIRKRLDSASGPSAQVEQAAMNVVRAQNYDLLADDGDPNLRHIAVSGSWSEDFHIQCVRADGRASFIIVRETPTRYKITRAQSDPSVLIKSQLRLARAGLQTVAAIAEGILDAYVALPKKKDKGKDLSGRLGMIKGLLPQSYQAVLDSKLKLETVEQTTPSIRNGLTKRLAEYKTKLDELNEEREKAQNDDDKKKVDGKAAAYFENTIKPALQEYVNMLNRAQGVAAAPEKN